jgi:hypothetical protein
MELWSVTHQSFMLRIDEDLDIKEFCVVQHFLLERL